MFYDLDDPIEFARDVAAVLAPDGIWHFEQSYMPAMLRTDSYDTICHEHLEYYSLGVVKHIVEAAGLKLRRRADERGQRRQLCCYGRSKGFRAQHANTPSSIGYWSRRTGWGWTRRGRSASSRIAYFVTTPISCAS